MKKTLNSLICSLFAPHFRFVSALVLTGGLFVQPAGAALLVEMNFNDSNGNATLANSGSINFTGQFVRQSSQSTNIFDYGNSIPSVNSGGFSASSLDRTQITRGKVALTNDISSPSRLTELDNLSAMTLTGWVNLESGAAGTQPIFNNDNSNTGFKLDYDATNSEFIFRNGSGNKTFETSLSASTWTFVAVVFDSSAGSNERFAFYSGDGTTLNAAQFSTDFATSLSTNSGDLTTIGGQTGAFNPNFWQGSLDNIRVYDTNETSNLTTIMQSDDASAIPEPSTLILMLVAGGAFLHLCRKTR